MMKLRQCICLILIGVLLFGTVACKKTPSEPGENNTADPQLVEETPLYIVRDGVAVSIVYSDDATASDLGVVNDLALSIQRITGVRPSDRAESGAADPEAVELVVGQTGYEESQQVWSELRYGEGIVRAVGKKVILAAYEKSSYKKAVNQFLAALKDSEDENGNFSVEATFSIN